LIKDKSTGNSIISPETTTPRAPINVIEFERDWGIQRSDEDLYHYIKVKQLKIKIKINH